ncbi:response regulator [Pseudomonas sp. NPDC087639]|jgi:CheY-like chemotaxis protein|uniref:response regulator n=1 Tax=Pseudomonas sp. NPDC087639 TaxID=3364445 RepID=UPI0037F49B2E
MKWSFLIVDDDPSMAAQTSEILQSKRTLPGDEIVCEVCSNFELAKNKVLSSRYDLIVLDLQDDVARVEMKGQEVLDLLRENHFVPVVFYTGHAHKVTPLESPFVRVVAKGDDDVELLRGAVREVFSSGLPKLIHFIQEQQRAYLWAHVDEFWKSTGPICDVKDLAYLLSKRLSSALKGVSVRRGLDGEDKDIAHPIEMYVWPSIGDGLQTGDVVEFEGRQFVVLNPACDFAQGKVNHIVLAECIALEQCPEFLDLIKQKQAGTPYTGNQLAALKAIVGDNRQGKKVQKERYKYLPATVFMRSSVVDFQALRSVANSDEQLAAIKRIATLDTPFVESLLSKFSRYYGRIGTPDLNVDELVGSIISSVP